MYYLILQLRLQLGWETMNKYGLVLKLGVFKRLSQSKQPKPQGRNTIIVNINQKSETVVSSSNLGWFGQFRVLNTPKNKSSPTDKYSPTRQYRLAKGCKIRGSTHTVKRLIMYNTESYFQSNGNVWNKPVKMGVGLESNTKLGACICRCQKTTIIVAQDTSFI